MSVFWNSKVIKRAVAKGDGRVEEVKSLVMVEELDVSEVEGLGMAGSRDIRVLARPHSKEEGPNGKLGGCPFGRHSKRKASMCMHVG
jgi:hypothetical protein